ncbi:MAG TPA: YdcF family protein [Pseudolabrys sp.]|nr:YdcF family protein [Pseudolabrys sp.]
MFFFLSKTVALFLLPSNLFIALVVVGILLTHTRFRCGGIRMAIAGLVLLLIAGFSPAGNILIHLLESRFPSWDAARGAPDGIVVLGGLISTRLSQVHGAPVVDGAADRIIALAKLARQFPNARIVFAGGNGSLAGGPAEADFVGPLLDVLGVPRERVALERNSRNTAENAAFSKDIANPKPGARWLLVTSAWHMPRAVGCFRRAGFAVEAYPVDWRTGVGFEFRLPRSFAGDLGRTDLAVNEWLGLLAYWLTGRTSALLPGPV